jgi:Putative prokaryotic signal transducing protein
MVICPNCGMGSDDRDFCLECGVKVTHEEDQHEVDVAPDRELRTKAVYKAPDEISAITLQKVLESEGIRAWIQSIQVPWYDGIMKMVEGYWGKVMVFEDQEADARRVMEEYFRSLGPGLH